MHQIVCWLGLRPAPDPAAGAYSSPPDHLAGFLGAYFIGRKGKGGEKRDGRRGGAGSAPKLKFGPQNYFPGASAVSASAVSMLFPSSP